MQSIESQYACKSKLAGLTADLYAQASGTALTCHYRLICIFLSVRAQKTIGLINGDPSYAPSPELPL
jgi:hypothetical protein